MTAFALSQPQGAATSLDLNPHGIGQMLVVPYFSTQGAMRRLRALLGV
jgi:hypothetical protein